MSYTLEVRGDLKLGLAAEMLRRRGTVRLELRGTSMLPCLWPGDLLTIQNAVHDEVVPGDISWITRGDGVPHSDPPVAASELLGRVTGIRRANRSFVPSRRISLLQSALAWMLRRWDHFRSLALLIHTARLHAGPARTGQFCCGVFGAVRGITVISSSRTFHQ